MRRFYKTMACRRIDQVVEYRLHNLLAVRFGVPLFVPERANGGTVEGRRQRNFFNCVCSYVTVFDKFVTKLTQGVY